MKVLLINSVCGVGSTGRICTDIADELKKSGHECKIAYGRGNVPERYRADSIKIGTKLGVYLHALFSRLFGKTGTYGRLSTAIFIKKIKKYSPDVIHLHNLHGYYINVKKLFEFLKSYSGKVVWTLHDCWAFTGHCPHFAFEKCEKWKTGCFNCPRYNEYPKSFADDSKKMYRLKKEWFTGLKNLTVVTPSEWLKNLVKQSFLSEYPVKVIYNGIDLSEFSFAASDFKFRHGIENKFIVLGVAFGWGMKKGLDVFKKLSETLGEKYRILLVGTDEKTDAALPKNVISVHRTESKKQLAEIYSAASVFVNPTREEVLGLVNIEANACGTPVVTFDTGGSPECIDDKSGIVVKADDFSALVKAIKSVCEENTIKREDCVKRAQKFDKNEKYIEYVKLYEGADLK